MDDYSTPEQPFSNQTDSNVNATSPMPESALEDSRKDFLEKVQAHMLQQQQRIQACGIEEFFAKSNWELINEALYEINLQHRLAVFRGDVLEAKVENLQEELRARDIAMESVKEQLKKECDEQKEKLWKAEMENKELRRKLRISSPRRRVTRKIQNSNV